MCTSNWCSWIISEARMSVIVFVEFDDTCATSLRMLMGFDGNVKGFCCVQCDSHCELGSRPYPFAAPGGLK